MEYQYQYQLKKVFNFKLIGLGLFFLADYNIGVIDVLPDFVGLAVILAGIGKSSYINNNFNTAVRYIKIWLGVASVKAILNAVELLMRSFNDSDMLMFASVFGMTELIFALIVFSNILVGCDILLNMDNIYENSNKLKYISPVLKSFFVVKFLLQVAAQAPLLLSENTYDFLSVKYNVYFTLKMAKDIVLPPCLILATLLGLFALSIAIPFFNSVSKSNALNEIIKAKINDLLMSDRLFMIRKSFDAAFGFFAAGIFFCIDFEVDKINFMPDFVIYIFLIAGLKFLCMVHPHMNDKKLNIYMVSGLSASVAAYIFTTAYRAESLHFFVRLVFGFRICSAIFCVLSNVLLFAVFVRFFNETKNLRRFHINFAVEYLNKYITKAEINAGDDKKYKRRLVMILAIVGIAKIASYLLGDTDAVIAGTFKFLIASVLFAFAVLSIKYIYKIKNDIYSYYN